MQLTNVEELMKKIGVKGVNVKSGANKDIGSPFLPLSPEGKEILQSLVDNVHSQFVAAVAKGRSMEEGRVRKLADGRVLRKPGNLFNLTEGMLWGTLQQYTAKGVKADFDGDGKVEFGEALPDAAVFKAAADAFALYSAKLDASARAWKPTASDAFTAVVVMVPTMSEYFGQWKTSRFVLGDKANGDAFNVVSRLSDIGDILGGLRVIYAGIRPAIASVDAQQAAQTKRELDSLWSYVGKLRAQEKAGRRFTPQQADTLGRTAQERANAIAGQVTQSAARLKVKIAQ